MLEAYMTPLAVNVDKLVPPFAVGRTPVTPEVNDKLSAWDKFKVSPIWSSCTDVPLITSEYLDAIF